MVTRARLGTVAQPRRVWGVSRGGGELGVRSTAAGETELPQVPGGAVIVVDNLVNCVGVDLGASVAVDRRLDVADQLGQLRLVVGADALASGASSGVGSHGRDGTAFWPGWARGGRAGRSAAARPRA